MDSTNLCSSVWTVVSVLTWTVVSGQLLQQGSCPDVKTKACFNILRYLGTWYEAERFFHIPELGCTCSSANYTLRTDGVIGLDIANGCIDDKSGEERVTDAAAVIPNLSIPSELKVAYHDADTVGNYLILDTNYESYAVVYSCTNNDDGTTYSETAWILSRDRSGISALQRITIYIMLKRNRIDPSHFREVSQTDCI